MFQRRQGPEIILELVAEELFSPWDLEEQALPEKFYLGR